MLLWFPHFSHFSTILGRVEPSDSRSTSPENTIRHPEQSQTPSSSPENLSHTLAAATEPPDYLPTTPTTAKSLAALQNSLLPTNLYASSSYSSLPSSHFSFTPRKGSSSSQSSEISVATFPHRSPDSPSDNLYSSRRPRPKTLMGPPPDPISSRSDVLYSQPFSSSERNLSSMRSTPKTRNYQNRPHILVDKVSLDNALYHYSISHVTYSTNKRSKKAWKRRKMSFIK